MSNTPPTKKPEMNESPVGSFKRDRRSRGLSSSHGSDDSPAAMQHDESNWLVSYADMMTLLFGFFVLLYSFSRIDEKKFEIIRKDVARYFGGQVKVNPTVKKLEKEIQEIITQAGLDKKVELVARDSEIELRFQGTLHFVSGTANLTKDSSFILGKLIDQIKRGIKADSVSVEGHTDDEPIFSTVYPSNWELSAARASTVIREFEKYGFDPAKLTAKGFGSSRPLLPNRDSKGDAIGDNQEINRRVIVTVSFSREIEDAIRAIKSGQFVSADSPELDADKAKTALVREGEGEPTWREKVSHDLNSVQEKLKLAEDRLKETEEKNRAAKQLADMQGRLQQIETKIITSEGQTQKYIQQAGIVKATGRMPSNVSGAPVKPAKKLAPKAAPKSKEKKPATDAKNSSVRTKVAPVVAGEMAPEAVSAASSAASAAAASTARVPATAPAVAKDADLPPPDPANDQ